MQMKIKCRYYLVPIVNLINLTAKTNDKNITNIIFKRTCRIRLLQYLWVNSIIGRSVNAKMMLKCRRTVKNSESGANGVSDVVSNPSS